MTATPQKMSPQAKSTRTVALVGGWVLFLIAAGAVLFLNGRPLDGEAIFFLVIAGGVITLLVAGAVVGIYRDWGPPMPPLGYRKQRFELAQWRRWYNCLFLYPIFLTSFAIQAAAGIDGWLRTDQAWGRLIIAAFYPFMAFGLASTLIVGPRGKPGTPARQDFEGLNDELTLAHAGVAYRSGFYAAFVGLIAIAATAVLAPNGVLHAVIGACWLASMTTVIRFGLLQRAAEPKPGEV